MTIEDKFIEAVRRSAEAISEETTLSLSDAEAIMDKVIEEEELVMMDATGTVEYLTVLCTGNRYDREFTPYDGPNKLDIDKMEDFTLDKVDPYLVYKDDRNKEAMLEGTKLTYAERMAVSEWL